MSHPPIQFSKIRRMVIIDCNDVEVGEPVDIGFSLDLTPKFLVIGGGFIEELLEIMERREDIDQIIDLDIIQEISDAIYLKVPETDLPEESNIGTMMTDIILFSQIFQTPMFDIDGLPLGKIKDVIFSSEKTEFIFENPEFNKAMSMRGYGQKLEFKVPKEKLSYQNGLLMLALPKEEIESKIQAQIIAKSRGKQLIALS